MTHPNQHLFPGFTPEPRTSGQGDLWQILVGLALVGAWLCLLGGVGWLCVEAWKLTGL